MNKPMRVVLVVAVCAVIAVVVLKRMLPLSVRWVPAPAGPGDLGPATGLSTPPAGAVVFDLEYKAQTGGTDDIQYFSYWGYGGSTDEAKTNLFLQEVRKRAGRFSPVYSHSFKGRQWSAVEYRGRRAKAFYFDLNADGKLGEDERIPPTRKSDRGIEFITPDFMQRMEGGGEMLCRTVLQVNFFPGNSEPSCMWSPAALLEGTASVNGQAARLLLYSSDPGGRFDRYGGSSYSLLLGEGAKKVTHGEYIPRERLSSLVPSEGGFWRLSIEGRRSNGLPARVVLVKDTSPTGGLAVKMAGSNVMEARLTSLFLQGVDDETVYLRVAGSKGEITLPIGSYAINDGTARYGGLGKADEWEVTFDEGPRATVKRGETTEIGLGQPTLKVRAIEERERYGGSAPAEKCTFKRGTQIFIEPRILGKGGEMLTRFQQSGGAGGQRADRPPRITITGSDGKQLLAKSMEYG